MTIKTDIQLLEEVKEELNWEPLLGAADVIVRVETGIVKLSGTVNSLWKKRMAEKAADRVSGIKLLLNEVDVRILESDFKTDKEIETFLAQAFNWHVATVNEKIVVSARGGCVTLSGEVEWMKQKQLAEQIVESVLGVIEVKNQLHVAHGKLKEAVMKRIQSAFYRHAAFDAKRITIENDGGRIYLTGEVRSAAEKRDAENAAWATPGVKEVVSFITIEEEFAVL